jgi:serine/threonine protein kinase
MLGQLLDGRYQVLQVLAGGGFSQTYIAQDTHRPGLLKCVVKHLKPVTRSPEFLETARRLFTKAVKSSGQISRAELVKFLAAKIPEPQKALQFEQRLLS